MFWAKSKALLDEKPHCLGTPWWRIPLSRHCLMKNPIVCDRYTTNKIITTHILQKCPKNVSCDFDKFTVDTHLCKLRNTPIANCYYSKMSWVKNTFYTVYGTPTILGVSSVENLRQPQILKQKVEKVLPLPLHASSTTSTSTWHGVTRVTTALPSALFPWDSLSIGSRIARLPINIQNARLISSGRR